MSVDRFWARLAIRLEKKTVIKGNCIVVNGGTDRYGYGRMRVSWADGLDSVEIGTHRLAYMVHYKIFPHKMNDGEVSHLCHNKVCVKKCHLVLEEGSINKEREHCKQQNICTKTHRPYCLLEL